MWSSRALKPAVGDDALPTAQRGEIPRRTAPSVHASAHAHFCASCRRRRCCGPRWRRRPTCCAATPHSRTRSARRHFTTCAAARRLRPARARRRRHRRARPLRRAQPQRRLPDGGDGWRRLRREPAPRTPQTAAACIEAMAAAFEAPVSVKCRTAAFEGLDDGGGVPEAQYDDLSSFVDAVTRAGCVDHVVVHARAAVLSGLSCSQNRQVPPLTPEYAVRLARDFPDLRVTLNGGIDSAEAVRRWSEPPLDGVMAGRWLLRRPLDLWALDPPADGAVHGTAADAISRYTEYAQRPVLSDGDVRARPAAGAGRRAAEGRRSRRPRRRRRRAGCAARGGGGARRARRRRRRRVAEEALEAAREDDGREQGGAQAHAQPRRAARRRRRLLTAHRAARRRDGGGARAPRRRRRWRRRLLRRDTRGGGGAGALEVTIYEAPPRVLQKVRISGGGRCNVCHDETKDARLLAEGYPRGSRTLLGASRGLAHPTWRRGFAGAGSN